MFSHFHRLRFLSNPKFISTSNSINKSIFFFRSTANGTSIPPTSQMTVPTPSVPPYRKRSVHIAYEIYENQVEQQGRRKNAKFIFTASYDVSDKTTKNQSVDDYCRRCQTTYYKRYEDQSVGEQKSSSNGSKQQHHHHEIGAGNIHRIKFIEARGEIGRMCANCRDYFKAIMDDVKFMIGKNEKKLKF